MSKKVFIISIILFIFDQISKSIVSTYLKLGEEIKVLGNIFKIKYINNTGASFGILENKKVLLIILSILAIIILLRYINSFKKTKKNIIGFSLLIGGILGNLSDRLLFGYVRDFFKVNIIIKNFPIFNLADIFIVGGVILLIISIILGEDKNGSKSK